MSVEFSRIMSYKTKLKPFIWFLSLWDFVHVSPLTWLLGCVNAISEFKRWVNSVFVYFTLHYSPAWGKLQINTHNNKSKHFYLSKILKAVFGLHTDAHMTDCVSFVRTTGVCNMPVSLWISAQLFFLAVLLILWLTIQCLAWRSSTNDWGRGIMALIHSL